MKRSTIAIIVLVIFFLSAKFTFSQEAEPNDSAYHFTSIKEIKTTPVKDQYRSGTCWSFATVSFVETELLRMKKEELDISEMYFVRWAYHYKANKYFRLHGTSNFGPGGQAHDVLDIIKKHGILTEQEYSGKAYGEENHIHGEIDAILKAYLDAVIKNKNNKVSPVWSKAYESLLDTYFGQLPNSSKANNPNKNYDFNPDDYVEITSYTHSPFYEQFCLEIPDNWTNSLYYNVPIEELIQIINNSIENNYSICWDGDVSEKGFSHKNGLAIVPDKNVKDMTGTEREKWDKLTSSEKNAQLFQFKYPAAEKEITQQIRQEAFDNYSATDDHLMHFTGMVQDQNGTKYYITKNSWNSNSNEFGGYLKMSEQYVRLNTIAIMVHKDAIPKNLKKKMGIK
ncbi:MAG: C1 family peptidase [Saprospiraceae bacterium]|nr:C1 family peptidase [Saprospiraceae bacterium]